MDGVYCVYAGNNCKFDDMMDLASTSPSASWKYRLGVAGMGFILPHRIAPTLYPLVPILEDKMVLVGPRKRRATMSMSGAVAILASPLVAALGGRCYCFVLHFSLSGFV